MAKRNTDITKTIQFQRFLDYLTRKGEELMWDAYYGRSFNNRLYNLHDSYGSAVFFRGRVIKSTIRYLGAEQAKLGIYKGWTWNKQRSMPDFRGERRQRGDEIQMRGRDEVMEFFQKYTPKTMGLHVVIVAAMFYANILESGVGLRRKYKVISGATTAVAQFAQEIRGNFRRIEYNRDLSKAPSIKDKTWA